MDTARLQDSLCRALCAEIRLHPQGDRVRVETPFEFPDGDRYVLFVEDRPGGRLRITDAGHTLMQLSYENDVDKFREGTRGRLFDQVLAQAEAGEADGELYAEATPEDLSAAILRLSQAVTRISDLTFLNRARTESTFYDDLAEELAQIVDAERITRDYVYPGMENAGDYPVDYRIEGRADPLFLFGIPGRDKARLATIVLERLLRAGARFDSLLIFADQSLIPRADLARLSNAGGEMVATLDAREDLQRKILRRAA